MKIGKFISSLCACWQGISVYIRAVRLGFGFRLGGQVLDQFSFVFSKSSPHTAGKQLFVLRTQKVKKWTVRFWTKMTFFVGPNIGPEPNHLFGPEPKRPKWPFLLKISFLLFLPQTTINIVFSEKYTLKGSNLANKRNTNIPQFSKPGFRKKAYFVAILNLDP